MKIRKSNLEALRIVAIILVLYIHAFGLISGMGYTGLGREITVLANSICNIGVSCFVLISGYFGIKFGWHKIIRMELMVIFYSLCMTLAGVIFLPDLLKDSVFETLVKSCLPIASRKYWFYSCYVCLVFMSPFLNKTIDKIEKKLFQKFLLALIILFSVFPTFLYFEITMDHGKGLVNMVTLYLLGRWIYLYGNFRINKKRGALLFLVLVLVNYASHHFPIRLGGIVHTFTMDNSITNIMMAVLLLYLFKDINMISKKINFAAGNVFAIFILNTFVMQLVHNHILKFTIDMIHSNWMPLWITIEVLLTLFICSIVEIIRQLIFGKIEENMIQFIMNKSIQSIKFLRKMEIKKYLAYIKIDDVE